MRVTLQPHVQPLATPFPVQRSKLMVVLGVLLLHGLALWALQAGLLQRMAMATQELLVPVSVLTEAPVPVPREVVKAAVPDKAAPKITRATPVPAPVTPVHAAQAVPQAAAEMPKTAPAADAPTGAVAPPAAAAVAPAAAPPAAPVAPKLELPSSTADYLHNPKPRYPRLSQSRNEQGTVILGVLVGVDGKVREVVVKTSSGYELLDRTAREAVLGWTFVPGKRNGAPVEMAVDVPIPFRLTE